MGAYDDKTHEDRLQGFRHAKPYEDTRKPVNPCGAPVLTSIAPYSAPVPINPRREKHYEKQYLPLHSAALCTFWDCAP